MGTTIIEKITTIIIEESPDFFIVRCGHCKGTGQKYPGYSGSHSDRKHPCPICEGSGFRKINIPVDWDRSAVGLLKCTHCSGTGQKYPGYSDTHSDRRHQCPTCGSIGVLAKCFPRVICSHCRGTGQKYPDYGNTHSDRQHKCPTCDGVGSIWINNIK